MGDRILTQAAILTGAPGSGKSSVLNALSTVLEIEQIEFGAIETEEFCRGWPWLSLPGCLPQLAAVIRLQRELGRRTFLVVATTENETELQAVVEAVAAEQTVVICLEAPAEIVAARVAAREPDAWPGKRALVDHARELASQIPRIAGVDVVVSTADRRAEDVAAEVRDVLRVRGFRERPG